MNFRDLAMPLLPVPLLGTKSAVFDAMFQSALADLCVDTLFEACKPELGYKGGNKYFLASVHVRRDSLHTCVRLPFEEKRWTQYPSA